MLQRLLLSSLLLVMVTASARAGLRSPQVPVSGSALATFFASQGQTIDVNADQLDLQSVSFAADATCRLDTFGESTITAGNYNAAGPANPALYQTIPGAAPAEWFSVLSFRTQPARLVVTMFDGNLSPVGAPSTYLGADRTNLGFYFMQNPGGSVFYSQDARNPDGAHILMYNGTGARAGSTWLVCETGPGPGGDFADSVVLLGLPLAPVPVAHTNWGTLKQRFR